MSQPPEAKAHRYRELAGEIVAVVDGETNLTARMASVGAMVAMSFPQFSWAGFYVVDPEKPDELVVGPYQGTLGCLRIAFGRGVCGAAARRRETIIVPDVGAFDGHIACDPTTKSEIVIPVFNAAGALMAVFDGDATKADAFDAVDAAGLEEIMQRVFAVPIRSSGEVS